MSLALADDAVRRLLLPGRLCMAALRGSAAAWMGLLGWLGTMAQFGEAWRLNSCKLEASQTRGRQERSSRSAAHILMYRGL